MKNFRILFTLLIFASFIIFSCNSGNNETEKTDSVKVETKVEEVKAKEGAQNTSTASAKFICPASCVEGKSDKVGACPNCGMDLIENNMK